MLPRYHILKREIRVSRSEEAVFTCNKSEEVVAPLTRPLILFPLQFLLLFIARQLSRFGNMQVLTIIYIFLSLTIIV